MYCIKSNIREYIQLRFLIAVVMYGISMILVSCGKDSAFDLLQSSGPVKQEQRILSGFFNKVSIYNNVNLVLSQGPATSIIVEGGSNLLNDITTEIDDDGTLSIRNLNNYNWVRSYDNKVTVYLQVKSIWLIRYETSGDITTTDTIHQDSLKVEAWGGSGTISMTVDCGTSFFVMQYGAMDFNISGHSGVTYFFANSYGPFHCLGLKSDITFIRNSGTNDCYVNAKDRIGADIRSLGNVYYSGNPPIVDVSLTGSGQLIHLE
jgi:hypothetical protein